MFFILKFIVTSPGYPVKSKKVNEKQQKNILQTAAVSTSSACVYLKK